MITTSATANNISNTKAEACEQRYIAAKKINDARKAKVEVEYFTLNHHYNILRKLTQARIK